MPVLRLMFHSMTRRPNGRFGGSGDWSPVTWHFKSATRGKTSKTAVLPIFCKLEHNRGSSCGHLINNQIPIKWTDFAHYHGLVPIRFENVRTDLTRRGRRRRWILAHFSGFIWRPFFTYVQRSSRYLLGYSSTCHVGPRVTSLEQLSLAEFSGG